MTRRPVDGSALTGLFFVIIAIIAGIGIAYLLSGCGGAAPLVQDRVVVEHVMDRCARRAPPAGVPVPRPTVCVRGKVCYDTPDAANLYDNVAALLDWAREIWAMCSPPPETQP